ISYMPQRRTTPDISAESLVLHGRFCWLGYPRVYGSADRQVAQQAMQRLGIASLGERRLAELSGGEQQRVYLAMQLAQGAKALLMDEPTTYLDIAHQLELLELIKTLKEEGKAIVMVLHDLDAALSIADQVVVMQGGRVLEAGQPEQVIASGAVDEAFAVRVIREERFGAKLSDK
ncbi:MAG: ABC transporter ATP-binding protein, partial [Coriobacteriales bacterium]|nr:ABC transporter ATP-binding protein [Coriobacteriales bacterium]